MSLSRASAVITAPRQTIAPTTTVTFALHLTGYLYAVGLRDAMADVIARHKALRTVHPPEFESDGLVLTPNAAPVPGLVPIPVRPGTLAAAVTGFLAEDADPATPVRAASFRLPTGPDALPEHLVVVAFGRRAADRVSPARLARDLMTAYSARRRNMAPNWSTPVPIDRLHVHELREVQLHTPAIAALQP
jgi:hypothetical protein